MFWLMTHEVRSLLCDQCFGFPTVSQETPTFWSSQFKLIQSILCLLFRFMNLRFWSSWVGPSLACGCTVVIKPPKLTPFSALTIADLAIKSGIPPGVLNVVMGDAPIIGNSLLKSPQVRKITFTGSTAAGKKLMACAAETVKKVSLELGGNAPFIFFDDADLEVAVKASAYMTNS
ncbi:putative succinate-semialdehyde dehydrogenase (NAD(+)) [Helianthus anomalus]